MITASNSSFYEEQSINDTIEPTDLTFSVRVISNPFTYHSYYSYTLPKACRIKIDVFNTLQTVKIDSIDFGNKKPGTYKFRWESSNAPSGVYFLKLRACDSTMTVKTMVIR
jgi:hypothetical protein